MEEEKITTKEDIEKGKKEKQPKLRKIESYLEAFDWFKDKAYRFTRDIIGESKKEMTARALAFCKMNEEALVIIMDIKRDVITMAHKDDFMTTDIQSPLLHTNQNLLKKVVYKKFSDPKKAEEALKEFLDIQQTLFVNFLRIVNNKEEEEENNNEQKD